MEPLDAVGGSFIDDLLNFSDDLFLESESPRLLHHQHQQNNQKQSQPTKTPTELHGKEGKPLLPGEEDGDDFDQPFPEVEGEMVWISNKDVFLGLDTFDIPISASSTNPKRPSPVSVLETSSAMTATAGWPAPPVRKRTKGKQRRRKGLLPVFIAPFQQQGKRTEEREERRRRCLHCAAEETPQWRAGPEGPKTLCNACGVRFKSGRLVPEYRPANSPTFSTELHSNSHRKIIEMRRRKEKERFYPLSPTGSALQTAAAAAAPIVKAKKKRKKKKEKGK